METLAIGIAGGIIALVIAGAVGWAWRLRNPSRLERKVDEVKQALEEWEARSAPPGSPPVDTQALAEAATERTARLLAEAVELQAKGKGREAIERLLTAYDMDLPPRPKAQLHLLAGNGFARLSEFEKAEGYYRSALVAAEEAKSQEGIAGALGNLGFVYFSRGDLEKAEEHYKRALEINDEIRNEAGLAQNLGNLGIVYEIRGDLDAAEQHFKRALAINEEIENKGGQASDLGNLGNVFKDRGDLDQAEKHLTRALAIHEELRDRLAQANALGNLGRVYAARGDLDKAEEYHKRALDIDKTIGHRFGQAQDLGSLGSVREQRGDPETAQQYYSKALSLFEEIGARPQNRPDSAQYRAATSAQAMTAAPDPILTSPRTRTVHSPLCTVN